MRWRCLNEDKGLSGLEVPLRTTSLPISNSLEKMPMWSRGSKGRVRRLTGLKARFRRSSHRFAEILVNFRILSTCPKGRNQNRFRLSETTIASNSDWLKLRQMQSRAHRYHFLTLTWWSRWGDQLTTRKMWRLILKFINFTHFLKKLTLKDVYWIRMGNTYKDLLLLFFRFLISG